MRRAALAFAVFAVAAPAPAAAYDESAVVAKLCAGMAREVPAGGGARADCADETRAIEVDYSLHWASALGQALYYGRALGKRPTVVLICRTVDLDGPFGQACRQHAFRAAYGAHGAADVLLCREAADGMEDCQRAGD